MDPLITLAAALAAYRVAHMVALEAGPWHAFEALRGWVFLRFGQDSWVTDGVTCPLCLSFWLALPAAAAATWLSPAASWAALPLWWLAIAGAVLVMHKAVDR